MRNPSGNKPSTDEAGTVQAETHTAVCSAQSCSLHNEDDAEISLLCALTAHTLLFAAWRETKLCQIAVVQGSPS